MLRNPGTTSSLPIPKRKDLRVVYPFLHILYTFAKEIPSEIEKDVCFCHSFLHFFISKTRCDLHILPIFLPRKTLYFFPKMTSKSGFQLFFPVDLSGESADFYCKFGPIWTGNELKNTRFPAKFDYDLLSVESYQLGFLLSEIELNDW